MMKISQLLPRQIAFIAAWLALALGTLASATEEIVVYSARSEHLIKPLFDVYTQQTGTVIRYISGQAGGLIERLEKEGKNTPADLLITVDAGNLWHAANRGLLMPVNSDILKKNIPAHLRDPQNQWFALSVRARSIVYSTQRVNLTNLSSYEALAMENWKGRLCLRTAKKVYNQSLVAMMIAHNGEVATQKTVKGWVANLAMPPTSSDTKAIEAVISGQCDVTIVNSYYLGRLIKKHGADYPARLFWANQNGRGTHVNISGAGITRHSKNKASAAKLLEWLSGRPAQAILAKSNFEYPANPQVPPAPIVQAWGQFKQDTRNVAEAGKLQTTAVKLMDRAGYK